MGQAVGSQNKATECRYKIAQCVSLKGKPFADGKYIKETILKSAEILFGDSPNKKIIVSRITAIPVSARSVERRITDLAENVTTKQIIGLKQAQVFCVALDENTDLDGLSRLGIIARYIENNQTYKELCCLLLLYDTTKAEDILNAFISY